MNMRHKISCQNDDCWISNRLHWQLSVLWICCWGGKNKTDGSIYQTQPGQKHNIPAISGRHWALIIFIFGPFPVQIITPWGTACQLKERQEQNFAFCNVQYPNNFLEWFQPRKGNWCSKDNADQDILNDLKIFSQEIRVIFEWILFFWVDACLTGGNQGESKLDRVSLKLKLFHTHPKRKKHPCGGRYSTWFGVWTSRFQGWKQSENLEWLFSFGGNFIFALRFMSVFRVFWVLQLEKTVSEAILRYCEQSLWGLWGLDGSLSRGNKARLDVFERQVVNGMKGQKEGRIKSSMRTMSLKERQWLCQSSHSVHTLTWVSLSIQCCSRPKGMHSSSFRAPFLLGSTSWSSRWVYSHFIIPIHHIHPLSFRSWPWPKACMKVGGSL